jgi:predicted metalloprotease
MRRRPGTVLAMLIVAFVLAGMASAARRTSSELTDPQQIADAAFPELNALWKQTFQDDNLGAYKAPRYYHWYNKPGNRIWLKVPKGCDSYRATDGYMWGGYNIYYRKRPNSFYCPINRQLYLDWGLFTNLVRRDDAEAYVVVGHEFGHHIQELLQWPEDYRLRLHRFSGYERMADCYAGIFFKWEAQRNNLDDNDLAHAERALGRFGDPDHTPWYEPGAHGGTSSREDAFLIGYDSYNIDSCAKILRH